MSVDVSREDGFTLVEMLIVCVLMVIVLGATLTALNSFANGAKTNEQQNEAQDAARQAIDLLARELRNLASPTPLLPKAVDVAAPRELVFQSEGKDKPAGSLNGQNTRRLRYCLAADGTLWRQTQTWTTATPPAVPSAGGCPGSGWTTQLPVIQHVVNGSRAIFTYNASALDQITEVGSQVFVDINPARTPAEVGLQTSVYLRNQNRVPEAAFSVAVQGSQVLLNGSESKDPEEKPLTYDWYDADTNTKLGSGIVFTTTPATPGTHSYYLKVSDGTLVDQAPSKSVCVPGTGVTCPVA